MKLDKRTQNKLDKLYREKEKLQDFLENDTDELEYLREDFRFSLSCLKDTATELTIKSNLRDIDCIDSLLTDINNQALECSGYTHDVKDAEDELEITKERLDEINARIKRLKTKKKGK